jgi:hypothetical protein
MAPRIQRGAAQTRGFAAFARKASAEEQRQDVD